MENLFNLVFKASLYGSIVGIIILLVKRIFKNKINPKYNYIIWMLLIIKLLVPVGPQSSISLFNISNENQIIEYISPTKEVNYIDYNENKSYAKESTKEFKSNVVNNSIIDTIISYLPAIWIVGTVNICFVFIISHLLLHKKIRKNSKICNDNINNILTKCKSKMKIKSNLHVVISDIVQTPSLVGVINPKILLPSNMSDLEDKELEYVFLHELAHYKRKDILINYLLITLQSIHWFNPTIWYFFKRIREDMEFATDEKVLKILSDNEHKNYGMAILTVLEKVKYSKFTPGIIGMIEDKNSVKKRIENIKNTKLFKSKKLIFTVVGVSLVFILGSVLLTSAKSNKQQEMDYAKSLYEYKSKYIGDVSNIGGLLNNLHSSEYMGKYYKSMEIQTEKEPYELKINYDIVNSNISKENIEKELYLNSVIILSLMDNAEIIKYNINSSSENYTLEYNIDDINKEYNIDIREKSKTLENFREFIKDKVQSNYVEN